MKDNKKAEDLQEAILAIDGIAIIVHPENVVADLTLEQISAIFKGEILSINPSATKLFETSSAL